MNWHETAWTTARLRVRTGWAAALCLFFWLFVAGALPGYAQTYVEVHRRDPFLMQSLLQAEAGDFLGDGRTGLALSGRNYETNEVYVYVLYWNGRNLPSRGAAPICGSRRATSPSPPVISPERGWHKSPC